VTPKMSVASVHGRFQPFHLEHLEYVTAAIANTEFLHIGVTQFETAHLKHVHGAGDHRDNRASNPLTYFERAELISLALTGAGYTKSQFRVGPFPIEHPNQLADFLPTTIPILTTRVDEWNDRKIALLTDLGYSVRTLFDRDPKGVAGSSIRSMMADGDESWHSMVPKSTIPYLVSLDLGGRIKQLTS
jgi:nicotinamide mononucleotide adenylyltransferase